MSRAAWSCALGTALLVGCSQAPKPETKPVVADIASVDSTLVPNLRRVSATIYSSGKPEGERAFRAIAALGIRTIISVDGEKPDVETARRVGLRYVHLPFMYSGIPETRALEIAKAARDLPGPVLIHCHHGKHRAPAGAAVARLAVAGGTIDAAIAEMKAAGADPRYKGLYRSVASFRIPTAQQLDAVQCGFPELAPPDSIVDTMVDNDYRLDRLESGKPHEGDYAHEALLLRESLFELRRLEKDRDDDFKKLLDAAVDAARALEVEAAKGRPSPAVLKNMKQSCAKCHDRYRNQ